MIQELAFDDNTCYEHDWEGEEEVHVLQEFYSRASVLVNLAKHIASRVDGGNDGEFECGRRDLY